VDAAPAVGETVGAAPATTVNALTSFTRREEILARARCWIDAAVPYDRQGTRDGYRTDCSGYLSYAWRLDRSYTTRDLDQVCRPIGTSQLLPGDGLLWQNQSGDEVGHVVIFAAWRDAARTVAAVWELAPGCARTSQYHYVLDLAGYVPVRYRALLGVTRSSGHRS
jgi:cell wall-associated NlpC family hydrolase